MLELFSSAQGIRCLESSLAVLYISQAEVGPYTELLPSPRNIPVMSSVNTLSIIGVMSTDL